MAPRSLSKKGSLTPAPATAKDARGISTSSSNPSGSGSRCFSRRRLAFGIAAIGITSLALTSISAFISQGAQEGVLITGAWWRQLLFPWSSCPCSSSSPSSPSLLAVEDSHTQTTQGFVLPSCPYYEDIPTPFPASFWYVKSFKTASSTLGGVFRSIGAHHGVPIVYHRTLSMDMDHGLVKDSMTTTYDKDHHVGIASHIPFSHRTAALFKPPFYLFSSVREPVSRFHSFYVEKCLASAYGRGKQGSAGNKTLAQEIREINEKICSDREDFSEREAEAMAMTKNPQLAYLRDADYGDEKLTVESVASNYDFLFVKERLDESLVAFAILYNLDFKDIVHTSSKVRGGTGKYPEPDEVPAKINDLVRSKTGKDLQLWEHANSLLDGHIATISEHCGGEAYFKQMVELFGRLQDVTAEECGNQKWYKAHGFETLHTYWRDNGVSPRCRDHVVKDTLRDWQRNGGKGGGQPVELA